MADLTNKFNEGENTSSSIDRQFTPEFVTKAVAEMAPRKRPFSKLSNFVAMPKNHGDKLTKEVRLPILHKDNLVDGNVDANTAAVVQYTWYVINPAAQGTLGYVREKYALFEDASGIVHGRNTSPYIDMSAFQTLDAAAKKVVIDAAIVSAKADAATTAAETAGFVVKSGAGSILNGKASYAAAAMPTTSLPEEGGVVNLMNGSSKLVTAKLSFHGIGSKYTVRSVKLDSRKAQVAQKIKDLSRATHELKEIQVQASVIAASEANVLMGSATSIGGIFGGADHKLDYDLLNILEQDLLANDVPMVTEILEGTTKVDTKVIEDAWVIYINRELMPTVRKMTDSAGNLIFVPKSKYSSQTTLLDGEFGSIGSFRFAVLPDLQAYRGAGAYATDTGLVGGTADMSVHATGGKVDVFPMLVVGVDSFVTTGFTDSQVTAAHISPARDVHNDMHAQVGGVASSWTYGFLNYRPERIRQIAVPANKY